MCGIFGFTKLTDKTRLMAPVLATYMEERGRDSYGVVGITGEPTNYNYELVKDIGPISSSFYTKGLLKDEYAAALFHTRAASQGSIEVENAHPFKFESDHAIVIGTHNGVISNHAELHEKDEIDFNVDSMHIWYRLVNNKTTSSINGWGSCAALWIDKATNKHYLLIFKFNHDALHLVQTEDGALVYASTPDALKIAHRFAYGNDPKDIINIKGDTLYALDFDSIEAGLYPLCNLMFGGRGMWQGRNPSNNLPVLPAIPGHVVDYGYHNFRGSREWWEQYDDDDDIEYKVPTVSHTVSPAVEDKSIEDTFDEIVDEAEFFEFVAASIMKAKVEEERLTPPSIKLCRRCNISEVNKNEILCGDCISPFYEGLVNRLKVIGVGK